MTSHVIDTDPGFDDAIALLYMMARKEDIKAISTVAGNQTIENVTRNAQYLVDYMGINIPVYPGAAQPLNGVIKPPMIHGKTGLGEIILTHDIDINDVAYRKLFELADENTTLIALSPLTNISKAIHFGYEMKENDKIKKYKELIIMGGAIAGASNANRVAEYNMFTDPEAACQVIEYPIKKRMVPLEGGRDLPFTPEELAPMLNGPHKEVIGAILNPVFDYYEKKHGKRIIYLYDPAAVFSALYPEHTQTEDLDIIIETKGTFTRGMTVVERRPWIEKKPNVTAVTRIDKDKFLYSLNDALG